MKALKWIAIILLVVVLLLVGGVLIFVSSAGLQKSIVMGQLEGKVQHIELDYFKAGFSSVTVRGLVLDQDGTLIELPSAEVDYSLMSALFSKKLVISKLAVDDLAVTLPAARPRLPMGPGPVILPDQQKPAAKPKPEETKPAEPKPEKKEEPREPPPPFEGIFGKAQSPVQLYIDGVDINATVAMTPERKLKVKVTGGGIAPGATGSIKTQGVLTDSSEGAAAAKVEVDSTLQIAQTDDKRLNSIILDAKTDASGGSLTEPASLVAKLDLHQEDSGKEVYTFTLNDGSKIDLIDYQAYFDPAKKQLAGKANVKVTHRALTPITGGNNLPFYNLQGQASFDLNSDTYAGSTDITAQGLLVALRRVNSKLKAVPDLEFSLEYNGTITSTTLTAKKAIFDLKERDGADILAVNLLQPITVGEHFDPSTLSGKIAEVDLQRFSLSWIAPMVDGLELSSGNLRGKLVARADKGTATLTTNKPIVLDTLTVSQSGKPLLENVSVTTVFYASLDKDSFTSELKKLDVRNAKGHPLISATAESQGKIKDGKASDTSVKAEGNVYFRTLLLQPFAAQPLAGPVNLKLNLSAKQPNPEKLLVETLAIVLSGKDNAELASAKLLKPLDLNLADPKKNTPESMIQGDVLQILLTELPRDVINAFLGDTKITSGNVTADLLVSGDGKNVTVSGKKPILATNLSVSKAGQPLLKDINAVIEPNISHNSKKTTIDIPTIKLKSGPVELASGKAEIVATPGGASPLELASFDLKADLAQILEQPVLAKMNNLAAGTATMSGKVTSLVDGTYDIKVDGKGLRVVQPAGTIKGFSLTAEGKLGDTMTIKAPLEINGPRGQTAAQLAGWVKPGSKPMAFKMDASGKTIYTEDLQLLAAAFKKPEPAAQPGAPAPTPAPTTQTKPAATPKQTPVATSKPSPTAPPPWADYNGTATLKVAKVVHGDYQVTDIDAALKVDPTAVVLKPAQAVLLGAPLKANMTVDHQPGQRPKAPYGLDANLNLTKFDIGKFLIMTQPGKTPPLTGQFNVFGGVQGTSAALETIAERAQGKFTIKGGPGQLRALAGVKGGETTGKIASGIAGAASLFLGDRVRELPALQQLISLLQQIDYDTLRIEAERAADLNINLNTFLVQGPQVRLQGQGQVKHVAGTPIPEQPLNVAVSLDAKDRTANLMKELRMITGKQDKQGYFSGPTFNITGTPSAPDFSELNTLISKSATEILSGGFGGKVDKSEATTEKEKSDSEQAVKSLLNGLMGN